MQQTHGGREPWPSPRVWRSTEASTRNVSTEAPPSLPVCVSPSCCSCRVHTTNTCRRSDFTLGHESQDQVTPSGDPPKGFIYSLSPPFPVLQFPVYRISQSKSMSGLYVFRVHGQFPGQVRELWWLKSEYRPPRDSDRGFLYHVIENNAVYMQNKQTIKIIFQS